MSLSVEQSESPQRNYTTEAVLYVVLYNTAKIHIFNMHKKKCDFKSETH